MTKKNYIAIAEILKEAGEDARDGVSAELILKHIANNFSRYARGDNSLFDTVRFHEACNLPDVPA